MISESVVCVYKDSAYRSDCSSALLSRNVFLSPLPPAWKYCFIVSRAASSTAHCFGDMLIGADDAFSMSFDMSCHHTHCFHAKCVLCLLGQPNYSCFTLFYAKCLVCSLTTNYSCFNSQVSAFIPESTNGLASLFDDY